MNSINIINRKNEYVGSELDGNQVDGNRVSRRENFVLIDLLKPKWLIYNKF